MEREKETPSQTTLDQMVENDRTQMIKAAIPYLPSRGRKIFSVYAKLTELMNTLSLFSPETQAMSISETPADPMEMLRDIREHSTGSVRAQMDQMLNMYAAVEMMRIMNDVPQKEDGGA